MTNFALQLVERRRKIRRKLPSWAWPSRLEPPSLHCLPLLSPNFAVCAWASCIALCTLILVTRRSSGLWHLILTMNLNAMCRLSVDKGWRCRKHHRDVRSRRVQFPSQYINLGTEAIALIKGRWLLFTPIRDFVMATDLEHPDTPHKTLISPRGDFSTWEITSLLKSTCRSSPIFTFHVALLH